MKNIRLMIAATACAVTSVLMAGPALASAGPSSHTPVVRAELKAAIKAQLAYNPAGKVIDANQISYDHGAVVVTLSVPGEHLSPDYTCPDHRFCFFQRPGLGGNGFEFNPASYRSHLYYSIQNWYPYALLGSVHNKWSHEIWISRTRGSGGPNLCYPPGGTGSPNTDLNWVWIGTGTSC